MIDTKMLEEIRRFGELKDILSKNDCSFVQWVMRIGEARNILNNVLIEFKNIRAIMKELEHNIPQFNKQPGNFKDLESSISNICTVIEKVNNRLSYIEETEDLSNVCMGDSHDEEIDEYEE